MVKIRLKRMGMKKKPFYRVVVADERASRDGRFIDELGYYNPVSARCSRRPAPSPNGDVIGRSPERQA